MFSLSIEQLFVFFLILCVVAVACLIIGMFMEKNNPNLISNTEAKITDVETNVKVAISTTETNLAAKFTALNTNIKTYVDNVVAAVKKV